MIGHNSGHDGDQHEQTGIDPELDEAQDDAIIGTAFGWSLIVIVALAMLAGGYFLLRAWLEHEPEMAVTETDIDLDRLLAPEAAPQPAPGRFVDITASAGIDFVHENGAYGERMLPETMGGGVAFLDYNDDDHPDLLFVNGDHWPFGSYAEAQRPDALKLYENDGSGRFREVTDQAGLGDLHFYGMGVAIGDYDGDGLVDIFATAVGANRLYRNTGGQFVEVTDAAGVAGEPDRWSTSAAFFDADNDGDLDLFVVNYVEWSREIDIEVDYRLTGIGRAYGPPTDFAGTHSVFYRNEGNGSFTDRSAAAGVAVDNPATGQAVGKGLALAVLDIDDDGFLDVVVANDTVRNFVFHNQGDGSFNEVGTDWGLGFDRDGHATGAMGIDFGAYADDGMLGIAIGNFANEMSSFYAAPAASTRFADRAISVGIGAATRRALTFGVLFFDYDLDGRLDLVQANGHVENEINRVQSSQEYRQAAQLFWNCGTACPGAFREVPTEHIGDLARPIVGRGAAYADIDGDGRLDLVLTQVDGPPLLLRNSTDTGHQWLRIRLQGRTPNTGAIGARLALTSGGVTQHRSIMPTRSYLSQVELPVTFGLGDASSVERLVIRWPDGTRQEVTGLEVNRLHHIQQP